jgi:hypothetical protein
MNPYRSVNGGSSLSNLVAVASLLLELWKKEPRFCRDRRTVGGRDSSGTMVPSSTDGGGVSIALGLGVTGVCGDDWLWGYPERGMRTGGRDGRDLRYSSLPLPRDKDKIERPNPTVAASAVSPYPGLGLARSLEVTSIDGCIMCLALEMLAARLRARARPGGSRTAISSSRAVDTSACASPARVALARAGSINMLAASGVRMR